MQRAAPRRSTVARAGGLAVLALLAWCSLLPLRPPAPAAGTGLGFSVERALDDVRALAAEPRAVGSPGHGRARDELIRRVAAIGPQPEVQEATTVVRRWGRIRAGRVANVLARLPGRRSTGAVLLMAHYDTVPESPGASDNAAGVAVLLETMRALSGGRPLRNDVIFLFSDAEEVGMLGSQAFFDQHPWAREVAVVLNFEARGAAGPSILFETGRGAAPLVAAFAASAARPVAASYSADVYRHLPNDTDFSVPRDAGLPGLNFAFIEDFDAYHSRLDSPARLAPDSLRHHGLNALALAHRLGDADLGRLDGGDSTHFTLPAVGLVVYSTALNLPLAAFSALVAAGALALGRHRGALRPRLLLLASPLVPLAVVAGAAGGWAAGALGWWIAASADPRLVLAAQCAAAVAAAAAVLVLPARRIGGVHLAAAATLLWAAGSLAAAVYLPGSSFLFLWSGLFLAIALLLLVALRDERTKDGAAFGAVVAAGPAVLVWVPTLVLVAAAFGAEGGALLAGLAALAATAATPALVLVAGERRPALLPVAAAAGAALLLLSAASPLGRLPPEPSANSLLYVLDRSEGDAYWATWEGDADAWTARTLGPAPSRRRLEEVPGGRELLSAPAAAVELPAPAVTLLAVTPLAAAGRRVSLRVAAPGAPEAVDISLRSTRGVRLLRVDGRPAPDDERESIELTFHRPPPEGVELVLELAGGGGVGLRAVSRIGGFPAAIAPPARGADFQPRRFVLTDQSLVGSVWELPAAAPQS